MSLFNQLKDLNIFESRIQSMKSCYHQRLSMLVECFEDLEDSNFVEGLKKDPNSRIWEMMVAYMLKKEGYELVSKDEGPDFLVRKNGKSIMYVEAVAPSSGAENHPDSVPDPPFYKDVRDKLEFTRVPVEKIALRLRSSFEEKAEKYSKYLEKEIINDNVPLVVAISSMKIPMGYLSPPAVLKSVLGFGELRIAYNMNTRERIEEQYDFKRSVTKRSSNTEIDMIPFLKEDYNHISAVLYSDMDFFSYGSFDPLKKSSVVHNPKCKLPLPKDSFNNLIHYRTEIIDDNWLQINRIDPNGQKQFRH